MAKNTQYLQGIDQVINTANQEMLETITTQAGMINQNPCLDGFIAEQHHVNTFNINAEASGSPYRAKIMRNTTKDSVDIAIEDQNGKIVRRYQVKYGKDAQATKELFEKGNYRGQQKLTPAEQTEELKKQGQKTTETIEAPDGTKSEPLTKADAKNLQEKAQSGNWEDIHDWKNVRIQDAAKGVAQNALMAGAIGAGVGALSNMCSKWLRGEKIEAEEVVVESLKSGADFGIKTATAGALKVAAEKGTFSAFKGIQSTTCTHIAFVAIENLKILADMGRGKMSIAEGFNQMGETTAAAVAGIASSTKGAAIGSTIGAVLGPVGAVVGSVAGVILGYMAGSEVGKALYESGKKVIRFVCETVRSIGSAISRTVGEVKSVISDLLSWW